MKELSIEEKYEMALGRARELYMSLKEHQDWVASYHAIENIFPELREESEDERIRKELIKFVKVNIPNEERYIAWLEKQGEPTDINPSEFDLHLNKLLKQFETLPKEELASSLSFYLNVVQNDGTYKEEKQGEQKHANKVEPKDYNGIDPYFGKPIDKVEPKFKVGDWVVENGVNGNPVQITSFEEDKGVGIKVWFSNGTGTWVDYLKGYHKWTIEDARDGDVLADNLGVILFKSIRDNNVINYYAYLSGIFSVQKDEEYWGYAVNCTLSPATKDQRERFFAAMHDAGYEWDADKKELKKADVELTDFEKSLKHIMIETLECGDTHNLKADAEMLLRFAQKPAWSEKDKKMSRFIGNAITADDSSVYLKNKGIEVIDAHVWLDELKYRVQPQNQWKPSDEQMEVLKALVEDNNQRYFYTTLNSLYEQLKKL